MASLSQRFTGHSSTASSKPQRPLSADAGASSTKRFNRLVEAWESLIGKSIVLIATGVSVATSLWLTSSAVASATPDVTGMTYDKASAALKDAGFTASVATRVGDQKSQSDCVVTNVRHESTPQSGDHSTSGTKVLVSLNCYATEASATSAGFSAASPEGKAAAAAAKTTGS